MKFSKIKDLLEYREDNEKKVKFGKTLLSVYHLKRKDGGDDFIVPNPNYENFEERKNLFDYLEKTYEAKAEAYLEDKHYLNPEFWLKN